ncbi:hypothetical protein RhiirA1_480138, partial [Rhizophagus irregularis]
LTNYRDPNLPVAPKSRGDIVKTFLTRNIAPSDYIEELKETRELFGGYNVIISDGGEIYHYNNILNETSKIQAGTHSLSNCSLNTPWPKIILNRIEGGRKMGYSNFCGGSDVGGYGGECWSGDSGGSNGSAFVLIVVLFILLIIVGAHYGFFFMYNSSEEFNLSKSKS